MVPSLPIMAVNRTCPEMRACLASGGYVGVTFLIRLAACTWPPTRIREGVTGFTSFTAGGGAADGIPPMMPPITPPAPPGTPPGTPPTTPPAPDIGGGRSSSLITAIFLGISFGAINLPASNCRGATLTIFGAAGGGGGGGAVRNVVNDAFGSTLV